MQMSQNWKQNGIQLNRQFVTTTVFEDIIVVWVCTTAGTRYIKLCEFVYVNETILFLDKIFQRSLNNSFFFVSALH